MAVAPVLLAFSVMGQTASEVPVLHVNADHDKRVAEVRDLLENFPQAYAPEGCNQTKSG